MNVYVDSSVLLRVVLRERGRVAVWSKITVPVASEPSASNAYERSIALASEADSKTMPWRIIVRPFSKASRRSV